MLYTLGERGSLLLENGRNPYNVYAGSHWILAVCHSLALGCKHQYLAQNRALGPYTLVLGSYMPVLGGIGLKMLVLGCRCLC
ncbi:hypothetical protein K443DRAFT_649370 [Laccaria amethystina LaAM-08-1]|uniref:Uncharacterized protein n=1 Tax=Laccaria amethystina LaAM-08-1 TaxID=1095629 RepID=A0A0C9WV65_9AGAR|nr:hypothetical protein K443DRAFT_649370 [Laccaria amethystina LaAM-08-1]